MTSRLFTPLLLAGCTGGTLLVGADDSASPPDSAADTAPPDTDVEHLPDNPETPEPTFSFAPAGGTFEGAVDVAFVVPEGQTAWYTLDGSAPSSADTPYTAPITLRDSAEVRVVVANAEGALAYAATSYLRVAADAVDFDSNLPLVVVWSDRALPEDDTYVGISLQVHDAGDDGRARLLGEATTAARAGLRVRGSSTAYDPKTSYALEIRADADEEDDNIELLGMPKESDWVLYAPLDFDRALIRNALMYQLSRDIGRYAPRTRFVEVFEAERGGAVSASGYVGVYVLMERIKRAPDRVDVAALSADDVALPEVSGGYVFKRDRVGDGEAGFSAGESNGAFSFSDPLIYVYPHEEDIAPAQAAYLSDAVDAFADALVAADGISPADGRHWREHIDTDAWVDHHALDLYAKNPDALRLSAYMYKDREGPIVSGPIWDFDRSMGCASDDRAEDPTWWDATNQTSDTTDMFDYGWYVALFDDAEWNAAYWARLRELLDGELSVAHVEGVIDEMAAELDEAAPRNYARWSSYGPRGGSYASEITWLKGWVEARHGWMSACLDAYPADPESCRGE